MFGCWTSVSRKSVLPVFEELNGLLFYPVQYEGEELSKNVFYTGAAPNQQAIPAVEYLMSKDGGGAKRFVLLGTDYVYPRTTNKILRAFLKSKGVEDSDIDEKYTPFGHSDYQTIVADIKKFSAGGKTAVVSTINGDSNVPFYKELGNQGLKATDVPVVAFSVGEEELRGVDTKPLVGHLAAWNYFMSLKNPTNDKFKKKWAAYAKAKKLPGADKPLTNDPMEATYIGIHMWAQAVKKAKSTDTDKVIAAMAGQTFKAPGGFTSTMDEKNHHLHKPVFIGEVKATASSTSSGRRRPRSRQAVEPVHRRQRQEEGRAREEVGRDRRASAARRRSLPSGRAPVVLPAPGRLAPARAAPTDFSVNHRLPRSAPCCCSLLLAPGAGAGADGRRRPRAMAIGDSDARVAAIADVAAGGDPAAPAFFQALLDGAVKVAGEQVFIVRDDKARDAASGAEVRRCRATPRTSSTATACAARSKARSPR